MDEVLVQLNCIPAADAQRELLKCCGSKKWAWGVTAQRPFNSTDELLDKADNIWWSLDHADWLEAFRSHPKIGETKASETVSAQASRWSAHEQSGTRSASADTMHELADANGEYERKFGFIFIVCATGKSTEEMLSMLRQRMNNSVEEELQTAAAEQGKIPRLRLAKLLASN